MTAESCRRELCRQVSEAVGRLSRQVEACNTSLYHQVSVLVAEYACEGVFSVDASGLDIFGVAGGHWWSFQDGRGTVESSHFSRPVRIPLAEFSVPKERKSARGELLDGSLLLVIGWHNDRLTRYLQCFSVNKRGTVTRLWGSEFSEDQLWVSEACLVRGRGAGGENPLQLVIPCGLGFRVFDALRGEAARPVALPWLKMSEYLVFQGHGDLLLLVTPTMVRVFSWHAQHIVEYWNNPLLGCIEHAFMPSDQTVQLIYPALRRYATLNVFDETPIRLDNYALPTDNASTAGRVDKHTIGSISDWITVKNIGCRLYAIL